MTLHLIANLKIQSLLFFLNLTAKALSSELSHNSILEFANNRNVEFPTSKPQQPLPSDPFIANILNGKVTGEQLFEYYLKIVLNKTKGNISEAAKILDIDRNTVREKMRKYGMNRKVAIESEK